MNTRLTTAITFFFLIACVVPIRAQSYSSSTAAPASPSEIAFKQRLARDCYVFRKDHLSPLAKDAFDKTRLFVIYYTHISCGSCVPVTKKLNAWYEGGKAPDGVSLVLGYRAPADNSELKHYVAKSEIRFPALDTKWIRAKRSGVGDAHPFYADSDEGAPRFRFFLGDGTEIDPIRFGASTKFGGAVLDEFDVLLPKMLK